MNRLLNYNYARLVWFCLLTGSVALLPGKLSADELPKLEKLDLSVEVAQGGAFQTALSSSGNLFAYVPNTSPAPQVVNIDSGATLDLDANRASSIAISRDDALVACSIGTGGSVKVFDATDGTLKWESDLKDQNRQPIIKLEFSIDGSKLLGATNTKTHVWDVASGDRLGPSKAFKSDPSDLIFANDAGTHLLGRTESRKNMLGNDYIVLVPVIFDSLTGEKVIELEAQPYANSRLASAPFKWQKIPGRPLLTAVLSHQSDVATTTAIGVWNTDTGKFQKVLHQGTLSTGMFYGYRFAGNNRHIVFHDQTGLQAVPTTGTEKQISLPFEEAGTQLIGMSSDAKRIAVLDPRTGKISFYNGPDFDRREEIDQIREMLKTFGKVTSKLTADGASTSNAQTAELAPKTCPPALRDDWLLNSLGSNPFATVGRMVDDEFLMCFEAAIPELQEVDGVPVWNHPNRELVSRFPIERVKVYRGNGEQVLADQARELLSEEQYVFVLPGGTGDANWANQLNPNAIVVGIEQFTWKHSDGKTYSSMQTRAFEEAEGLGNKLPFKPHDNLQLKTLGSEKPNYISSMVVYTTETRTREYVVTKYRMETRTRDVTKTVDGQPQTDTVQYTVQVPYQESIQQTYSVMVPVQQERFKEPPSAMATQFQAGGVWTSLRCFRATGQRIHPLIFLAYASRYGSFLELQPEQSLVPEMVTRNIKSYAVVAQFIPQEAPSPVYTEAAMREKLSQFGALLKAGEVEQAKAALFGLPIVKPLWAEHFYELAYYQHQAGKAAEAKETILAGAMLEWERPVDDFDESFKSEHADDSGSWVLSTRSSVRSMLDKGPIKQTPAYAIAPVPTPQRVPSDKQAKVDYDALSDDFDSFSDEEKIEYLKDIIGKNPDKVGWRTHSKLRHSYFQVGDERAAYEQIDIIFKKSFMNDWVLKTCAGWKTDPAAASAELVRKAYQFPEFKYLFAACVIKAAELQPRDDASRAENLRRVIELQGEGLERYQELAKELQGPEQPPA